MIEELKSKIASRRIVASISGGKDSAAMSLYLSELGIEHDRVFCDTGWEHEATYEYLRGPLQDKIGPITWIAGENKMEDLILKKGMFPGRLRRFCTQELKVFPIKRHLAAIMNDGIDVINAVGIRAGESQARSKMTEWEWQDGFDCEVWRPLIRWTEQDVIDIHTRHGLMPNPLYLRGASRVGCWPCIYARKQEVRLIADTDPSRIDRIRKLEQEVAERAAARAKAKGEEPPNNRTFFQARSGGAGEHWSIDKVVQWSRTSRGGKQYELFTADQRDSGCMRWGVCEVSEESDSLKIVCEGDGEVSKWTDEERAAYLDCPECGEPAIPASSVDRVNGRPVFQWSEDDGVVCPGCKANLIAFITGDENGDFFEARVRDDGEVSK